MKILITGGHLTPALSFIDFVKANHSADKLVFVGREFSQDATGQKAVERYEVEKRKVAFIAFDAVRLGGGFFRHFLFHSQRFITSLKQAKKILRREKPQVVLSFGGYVAVPLALMAKQLKISVITHEQTLISGFANKLIGLMANKIAVTFPDSVPRLFANKTVTTGNPLRAGVFEVRHPRPIWLAKTHKLPIIIIMGGNQGSQTLNALIEQALPELVTRFVVVHQCGQPTKQQNTREILERSRQRLPLELQRNYYIQEWIDDSDLFWLYRHAFCAVSRSGANATQELAAAGLPSILVPLPTARHNEQRQNALWSARAGGSVVIEQPSLNVQTLLMALEKLQSFGTSMRENLAALQLSADAAEKLYTVVTAASQTQ
jgi:UDP-N-acetylglucosamine--N-acetylmuramyl-(pentapeptide) pyrophosphoryl-undecaprenol N-acetylglucosamine transferase